VGLTPKRYQSGETDYDGGVSKCGDALLRTMLYEAAHSLLTHSRQWSWLKAWGIRVAQRRGIRRAIVAVARRLAVVLHRMWLDGSEFRSKIGQRRRSCGCLNPIGGERRKIAGKEITRSAPAAKCPHGDDGWGEFVRSAALPSTSGKGRPTDCTAPSFSSHHEAACPDLEEKREPRLASSAEAKGCPHEVIRLEPDTGRDREETFAGARRNGEECADSARSRVAMEPLESTHSRPSAFALGMGVHAPVCVIRRPLHVRLRLRVLSV
jgi:Transposase IS116/IS110/IS902 family